MKASGSRCPPSVSLVSCSSACTPSARQSHDGTAVAHNVQVGGATALNDRSNMAYNKDLAILAQNSGGIAANLVGIIAIGAMDDDRETVLQAFEDIRERVFNGALALAGAESADDVPAATTRSRGSYAPRNVNGGGGGNTTSPAETVVNFGKYKGMTLGSIQDSDPEYVEWLAEKGNNPFIKRLAGELLSA